MHAQNVPARFELSTSQESWLKIFVWLPKLNPLTPNQPFNDMKTKDWVNDQRLSWCPIRSGFCDKCDKFLSEMQAFYYQNTERMVYLEHWQKNLSSAQSLVLGLYIELSITGRLLAGRLKQLQPTNLRPFLVQNVAHRTISHSQHSHRRFSRRSLVEQSDLLYPWVAQKETQSSLTAHLCIGIPTVNQWQWKRGISWITRFTCD